MLDRIHSESIAHVLANNLEMVTLKSSNVTIISTISTRKQSIKYDLFYNLSRIVNAVFASDLLQPNI